MALIYRGIFWIKDLDNLESNSNYLIKIETNENGEALNYPFPLNSKNGNDYTHKASWPLLPSNQTRNKTFDYYPRGRVEIKNGDKTIYFNPILNKEEIINYIKKEYCLSGEVKIIPDFHKHYKCNLDRSN